MTTVATSAPQAVVGMPANHPGLGVGRVLNRASRMAAKRAYAPHGITTQEAGPRPYQSDNRCSASIPGATPNANRSASESNCAPKPEVTFKTRAAMPSR